MSIVSTLSRIKSPNNNKLVMIMNFLMGLTAGFFLTYLMPSTRSYGDGIVISMTSRLASTTAPPRPSHNNVPPVTVVPIHIRQLMQNNAVEHVNHVATTPGVIGAHQAVPPRVTLQRGGRDTATPIIFNDTHFHRDDKTVAEDMFNKVRVLCWVMTQPGNHKTRAVQVKNTWGKRCNRLLFMSEKADPDLPAIGLNVSSGRWHLTAKTMLAFNYIYHNYITDYDWFIKADDDTYVIMENLRYMLSQYSPSQLIYFGHHFYSETWDDMEQGYFSGGGGYVLSHAALSKLGQRDPKLCRADGGSEDVEIGYCMEKLGVKTGDSRDSMGRSRFHCFTPESHLKGGYPKWYYKFDKYGARWGMENISDYAISFHYIPPQKMYALEFYVYHLRPYGLVTGAQTLN